MSDPGTTYPTHEEVQRMRSTQDPIHGKQKYMAAWFLAPGQELKRLDKEAKADVGAAAEDANLSPRTEVKDRHLP